MAVTPPSPADVLPLRHFNVLYQPSPSLSPTSTTSPLPDVANALAQYQNEILGGPPVSLAWKNLKVMAQSPNGDSQTVLDSTSGFAEPFTMVAILGPSRSGKSTLLQALSGRLSRFVALEGEVSINGRRQQLTYGTAAYLTPKDTFVETLTVRENMHFSALLKLPDTMQMKQKMELVDQIILDMGLRDCVNWYSKGINMGERRRLNLAMELLMRPRLLYLDEPVDGLGSSASLLLIIKLKLLAREGRTVVACISEPGNDILQLFDYLVILGSGKTVYFGEASTVVEHFARSGLYSPLQQNDICYFLHIASAEYEETKVSLQSLQDPEKVNNLGGEIAAHAVKNLVAAYENSEICAKMSAKTNEIFIKKGAVLVNLGSHAGVARQIAVLTYRSFLNATRELNHYWARLALSTVLMLLIGTVFYKLNHSINSIQERASCIFLAVEILMFLAIGGMPFFFQEMEILVRERLNCHYHVMAFVIGNSLSSLPILLFMAVASSCVAYFLMGLHSGFTHFLYFVLNLYASLVAVEGLMMTISAIAPSCNVGMAMGSCVQIIFMLVAGYFCRPSNIPDPIWTYPVSYISFHRYAIWGLYQNEFLGSKFGHSTKGISGEHVIQHVYHMEYPGKWKNLLILSCMALVYRILFFLCINFSELLTLLKSYKRRLCLQYLHGKR